MGEMAEVANEKEDVQTGMHAGDLLCHQYSLCDALHFVDPTRYEKPDWRKGINMAWNRAYWAEKRTSTGATRRKLEEETARQNAQKIHNFAFIPKTMKLLIKEPRFVEVFNATYHSYDSKTR